VVGHRPAAAGTAPPIGCVTPTTNARNTNKTKPTSTRTHTHHHQVSWLRTTRTDLVVSDVVPIACAAAAQAGIPAVAVTNFSWGAPLRGGPLLQGACEGGRVGHGPHGG